MKAARQKRVQGTDCVIPFHIKFFGSYSWARYWRRWFFWCLMYILASRPQAEHRVVSNGCVHRWRIQQLTHCQSLLCFLLFWNQIPSLWLLGPVRSEGASCSVPPPLHSLSHSHPPPTAFLPSPRPILPLLLLGLVFVLQLGQLFLFILSFRFQLRSLLLREVFSDHIVLPTGILCSCLQHTYWCLSLLCSLIFHLLHIGSPGGQRLLSWCPDWCLAHSWCSVGIWRL